MKTTYNLICMSFDGDYVTEKRGFDTVLNAWEHAEDMGSRWYFYPFHFVTSASGQTIVASPDCLERFDGKRVTTVQNEFRDLSEIEEMQDADIEEFALALQYAEV